MTDKMEDMLDIYFCRVCLKWTKDYVDLNSSLNTPLHATSESKDAVEETCTGTTTYRDCYKICTHIQEEFKLQHSLCKGCAKELEIAYVFLSRALKAERMLQHISCETNECNIKEEKTYAFEFQETLKDLSKDLHSAVDENSIYIPVQNMNEFSSDENKLCTEKKDVLKSVSLKKKTRERKKTNKRLISMKNRNYHAQNDINRKSNTCEICGKQFATHYYMRYHMETHQEERPTYACDQCDKKYYYEGSLVVHKRMHSGNMFSCDECDKKYVSKTELRVHKRFHSRDYPYVCEICGQKYAVMSHLNNHMLRHQGMKVQCEECGKLFTSIKALHEHGFLHTGKMPFPCSYCDRGYPSRQKYKVHLKKLHDLQLTEEELRKCAEKTSPQAIPKRKVKWIQVA